jgi:hypothetical protein
VEFVSANWRLAAVAALFFVGVGARRTGWAGEREGRWLLTFVFNVGLPILILGALTGVALEREHALLPVVAICTSLAGWGGAVMVARRLRFENPDLDEVALVSRANLITHVAVGAMRHAWLHWSNDAEGAELSVRRHESFGMLEGLLASPAQK